MIQNLTPKEKDMAKAGIVLAVLVFAVVAWYHYSYLVPRLEKDKKQVETIQAEIKQLDFRARELRDALGNVEELKAKQAFLAKVSAKLPDSPDAPGFYQALVRVLQVTRVDYSELQPLKDAPRTVYVELPYKITCKARYHDLGHFLNLIEENPDRFMRVKTFTIENQDSRPSVHPVTLEIGTFMFIKRG